MQDEGRLSAFPITAEQGANGYAESGLTKREWFAGMALQGLLGCHDHKVEPASSDIIQTVYAKLAYSLSDAMIAASKDQDHE